MVKQKKSSKGKKTKKTNKNKPKKKSLFFLLKRVFLWFSLFVLGGLLVITGLVLIAQPDFEETLKTTRPPVVNIIARNGDLITSYGQIYGETITVDEVSPYLIKAIIATEDRRFFSHWGIDPLGIMRAVVVNLKHCRITQGGSTITQQVAKNLFLSNEKTFKRKAKELLIALWLEKKFSKEQILNIYLNRVYLGAGIYGMSAASQRYFNTNIKDLTLFQAAVLAGLLQAPSRYNPIYSLGNAQERAYQVLNYMVAAGLITKDEAEQAKQNQAEIINPYRVLGARHFADWIYYHELKDKVMFDEDLNVFTTLDPVMQKQAEEVLEKAILINQETKKVTNGAVVILNKAGEVLAMVGGLNYSQNQFNLATQASRQAGSIFKVFVYLAALEKGFELQSRFKDEPLTINGWSPKNYTDTYEGEITLSHAFAKSINTVAVFLSEKVGRETVIAAARKLGVTSPLFNVPSLVLGTNETNLWEMTKVYAVLANQGLEVNPYGITEVYNHRGYDLFKHESLPSKRLISLNKVQKLDFLLKAAVKEGTGQRARLAKAVVAGKTGTTQNNRDAWFIGYVEDYIVGVWVGNQDNTPMKEVTGGSLPAQIFREIMQTVL